MFFLFFCKVFFISGTKTAFPGVYFRFWVVGKLNLADGRKNLNFGGNLIWRMTEKIKFGGNLIWRMAEKINFGGNLIWRILTKTAKSAKFSFRQNFFL